MGAELFSHGLTPIHMAWLHSGFTYLAMLSQFSVYLADAFSETEINYFIKRAIRSRHSVGDMVHCSDHCDIGRCIIFIFIIIRWECWYCPRYSRLLVLGRHDTRVCFFETRYSIAVYFSIELYCSWDLCLLIDQCGEGAGRTRG